MGKTRLPYKVHKIDIRQNIQKEPWFLEINPNGRIPAITDTFTDGQQIRLFESGSVLQYLVEQYDTEHKLSYPRGTREAYEVNNWLFFQNAGVGPMQGQANVSTSTILHDMRLPLPYVHKRHRLSENAGKSPKGKMKRH